MMNQYFNSNQLRWVIACIFFALFQPTFANTNTTHLANDKNEQDSVKKLVTNNETLLPIAQHPENPNYLIYNNKTQFLATSAEHYAAVINKGFDFKAYLDELAKYNNNLTRLFSGTWRSGTGKGWSKDKLNFGTSLNFENGSFVAPWAKSAQKGGYYGTKFDLDKWNNAYFARLREFMDYAKQKNIIVEFVFFCVNYRKNGLDFFALPMHPDNCTQGQKWKQLSKPNNSKPWYNTLVLEEDGGDADFVDYQKKFVRKIVQELRHYPNLYYEIANEPIPESRGSPLDQRSIASRKWHDDMIKTIIDEENQLLPPERRHLIAYNFMDYEKHLNADLVVLPNEIANINIINIHYFNRALFNVAKAYPDKVLSMDETKLIAHSDPNNPDYFVLHNIMSVDEARSQMWNVLMNGGAIYDGLNGGYTTANPTGNTPDGIKSRQNVQALMKFFEPFEIHKLAPGDSFVSSTDGGINRGMSEPGRQYAIWKHGNNLKSIKVKLPAGTYKAEWINYNSGDVMTSSIIKGEMPTVLTAPHYNQGGILLRILSAEM